MSLNVTTRSKRALLKLTDIRQFHISKRARVSNRLDVFTLGTGRACEKRKNRNLPMPKRNGYRAAVSVAMAAARIASASLATGSVSGCGSRANNNRRCS
jgi:hypothetical protein